MNTEAVHHLICFIGVTHFEKHDRMRDTNREVADTGLHCMRQREDLPGNQIFDHIISQLYTSVRRQGEKTT